MTKTWKEECGTWVGMMKSHEQELMWEFLLALMEEMQGNAAWDLEPLFQRLWDEVKDRYYKTHDEQ